MAGQTSVLSDLLTDTAGPQGQETAVSYSHVGCPVTIGADRVRLVGISKAGGRELLQGLLGSRLRRPERLVEERERGWKKGV